MKRVSIFIVLKVAELDALLLISVILFFIGKWNPLNMTGVEDMWWHYVGAGLAHTMIFLGGGFILIAILYRLIKLNWEWAKKLK